MVSIVIVGTGWWGMELGKADYPVRPIEALRNVAVVEAVKTSSEAGGAWVDVAKA